MTTADPKPTDAKENAAAAILCELRAYSAAIDEVAIQAHDRGWRNDWVDYRVWREYKQYESMIFVHD